MAIDGKIEIGDIVKTLSFKVAIEGRVVGFGKKGMVYLRGTHYPGGPERPATAHRENLEITKKGPGKGK